MCCDGSARVCTSSCVVLLIERACLYVLFVFVYCLFCIYWFFFVYCLFLCTVCFVCTVCLCVTSYNDLHHFLSFCCGLEEGLNLVEMVPYADGLLRGVVDLVKMDNDGIRIQVLEALAVLIPVCSVLRDLLCVS